MHIKDDVINYQLSTGWLIFDHSLLLSKVTSRLLAHHSLQDLFFGTSVEHAHTHTKKKGGHVFWVMKEAAIFLKLSQQQKHPIFLSFWSDLSVPPHGWESFCEKNTGWRPRIFNLKPCTDSPKDHWVLGPWCKVQNKTSWLRSFYGWIPWVPRFLKSIVLYNAWVFFFTSSSPSKLSKPRLQLCYAWIKVSL